MKEVHGVDGIMSGGSNGTDASSQIRVVDTEIGVRVTIAQHGRLYHAELTLDEAYFIAKAIKSSADRFA